MTAKSIRFEDGAAYEDYMGVWSRGAGNEFLKWLSLPPGLRWLDVGCGNGAFTQLVVETAGPSAVAGIDPSEAQLDYARARQGCRDADFRRGDALALPFPDDAFDVAVMPLVIFFVPEPARGVAEMARVVSGGGVVAAYSWDMPGGGFPYATLLSEIRALGVEVPSPPSPEASRMDHLSDYWARAGLDQIETKEIRVTRAFQDFESYWTTVRGGPSVAAALSSMTQPQILELKSRLRDKLPADASGVIQYDARANAIRGRQRAG